MNQRRFAPLSQTLMPTSRIVEGQLFLQASAAAPTATQWEGKHLSLVHGMKTGGRNISHPVGRQNQPSTCESFDDVKSNRIWTATRTTIATAVLGEIRNRCLHPSKLHASCIRNGLQKFCGCDGHCLNKLWVRTYQTNGLINQWEIKPTCCFRPDQRQDAARMQGIMMVVRISLWFDKNNLNENLRNESK